MSRSKMLLAALLLEGAVQGFSWHLKELNLKNSNTLNTMRRGMEVCQMRITNVAWKDFQQFSGEYHLQTLECLSKLNGLVEKYNFSNQFNKEQFQNGLNNIVKMLEIRQLAGKELFETIGKNSAVIQKVIDDEHQWPIVGYSKIVMILNFISGILFMFGGWYLIRRHEKNLETAEIHPWKKYQPLEEIKPIPQEKTNPQPEAEDELPVVDKGVRIADVLSEIVFVSQAKLQASGISVNLQLDEEIFWAGEREDFAQLIYLMFDFAQKQMTDGNTNSGILIQNYQSGTTRGEQSLKVLFKFKLGAEITAQKAISDYGYGLLQTLVENFSGKISFSSTGGGDFNLLMELPASEQLSDVVKKIQITKMIAFHQQKQQKTIVRGRKADVLKRMQQI